LCVASNQIKTQHSVTIPVSSCFVFHLSSVIVILFLIVLQFVFLSYQTIL